MTPQLTVLVNTYNHERFIERCLLSVVEQDFPANETEVIVVDDGSTDHTAEMVRKFQSRVRLIRKENGGQVSAFNTGVAEARGKIIAFLDGDDWWATNKLTAVFRAFEENQQIAAVGHGYFEVDEHDSVRAKWMPEPGCRLTFERPDLVFRSRSSRTFLGTSRLAIRESALARTLPVPVELPFFDNFVFAQAIAIGGALLLAEPLCYYRVHSSNLFISDAPTEQQRRTRYRVLCGLLEHLPARLKTLGASDAAISAFLAFDRAEAARLKLMLNGGWSWETFRAEYMNFHVHYRDPDWGYRVFKNFVLLSTLLMPPKNFYRMRGWYAKHGFRRLRERVGSASLTAPDLAVVRDRTQKIAGH